MALLVFHTTRAAGSAKVTTITVTAGKPTELAFKLSKTSSIATGVITFKVTNKGTLSHDFKVCTRAVTSTKANTCTGKGTKLLKKGQSATLIVTILKKGTYEFLCTVPGHAAAGMKGLIGVGVKVTPTPTTTTKPTTTTPTPTPTTTTTTGPETLLGNPAAGAAVFTANGCGSCHTLAAAGTTGNIGPNLNSAKPSQATVIRLVTSGGGGGGNVMPPFTLSTTDLNNLAAYVYQSTH